MTLPSAPKRGMTSINVCSSSKETIHFCRKDSSSTEEWFLVLQWYFSVFLKNPVRDTTQEIIMEVVNQQHPQHHGKLGPISRLSNPTLTRLSIAASYHAKPQSSKLQIHRAPTNHGLRTSTPQTAIIIVSLFITLQNNLQEKPKRRSKCPPPQPQPVSQHLKPLLVLLARPPSRLESPPLR